MHAVVVEVMVRTIFFVSQAWQCFVVSTTGRERNHVPPASCRNSRIT